MSLDEGIKEFWRWWVTARDRIVDAIEVKRHFEPELVDEISRHVDGIGDLQWELAPGKTANHAFCLSANGDPADRLITELWRARGPEPDEVWEYHAARQPFPGKTMMAYEGVELAPGDLVVAFTVDPHREVIDATFFHPSLAQVREEAREVPVFLFLDGMFGRTPSSGGSVGSTAQTEPTRRSSRWTICRPRSPNWRVRRRARSGRPRRLPPRTAAQRSPW